MLSVWFLGAILLLSAQADPGSSSVVGGSPVAAGDWQDTAAILWGGSSGCTGVLIAPNLVLTAGHCVGGISHVRLGTTDYTYGGEVIGVTREIEYPNSWSTYDMAVLVLESNSSIPPRTIVQDCVLDDLYDGASVAIVGYGALDIWGNQYGTQLMEAVTTITDHDCSNLGRGCNGPVSPGGELGAGGDGVDACFGDSGGPLYLLTEKGDYLVGITSRAYNGVWAPCEEGGIYGRPDAIIGWIEDQTGVELPRPDCGQDDEQDDEGYSDVEDPEPDDAPEEPDENGQSNRSPDPSAGTLWVVEDGTGFTKVQPNDPDQDDTHVYSLSIPPEAGDAELNDRGGLTYTPQSGFIGLDQLQVRVTDNGAPQADAFLDIEIEVVEREPSASAKRGCAHGGPHWTWAVSILVLGALGTRRRARAA